MLGRDNVKALGFVLTDDMQCSTAAGADLDLGLDDDFDARQMIRQITALDAVASDTRRVLALRLGLCRGNSRLEILKAKRHLLWRKLFRTLAILTANIFIEDALKPLDLFVTMR